MFIFFFFFLEAMEKKKRKGNSSVVWYGNDSILNTFSVVVCSLWKSESEGTAF